MAKKLMMILFVAMMCIGSMFLVGCQINEQTNPNMTPSVSSITTPKDIAGIAVDPNLTFEHGKIDWYLFNNMEAFVIVPNKNIDPNRRWIWIAPPWLAVTKDPVNGSPQPCKVEYEYYVEELLSRGFHIVGLDTGPTLGSPAGAKVFDAYYEFLQKKYKFYPKARLFGQSNGGLIVYGWAFRHPEKVDRILGTMPALDLRSWPGYERIIGEGNIAAPRYGFENMTLEEFKKQLPRLNPIDNLKPLADAGVKILHLHGDKDHTVEIAPNSIEAMRRYHALGGEMELVTLPLGHQPGAGFYDSQKVLDFLTE